MNVRDFVDKITELVPSDMASLCVVDVMIEGDDSDTFSRVTDVTFDRDSGEFRLLIVADG